MKAAKVKIKDPVKTDIEDSIRVMSFNIRWKGCEQKKEPIKNCWHARRENVASMIRFHHMDLIGIQEPTKDQIDDLDELLSDYDWLGAGLDDGKNKGLIDAIFYLKNRFELLDSSYFYLSETPDIPSIGWKAKFIRGVTWAKFKDKKTKQEFYFFNTHFDYHSKLARNKSAELLKNKIFEISKSKPFVVTGDFNIFPELGGEETYKILTRNNHLIDAHFKTMFPHHGPTGSWSGFKEPGQPGIKPDYIFVDGKIKVISHGILADTFDGNYPSDHLPVIAELDLKA